jgi:hypothetical protein
MNDAVFTRTFELESGPRVRLRLARPSDRAAVEALLRGRGVVATELDVRRLLAYDPVRRRVYAAFAPLDGTDTLIGLGAIDLDPDAEVDTLVVDDGQTSGLGDVLVRVLRAQAATRRVA